MRAKRLLILSFFMLCTSCEAFPVKYQYQVLVSKNLCVQYMINSQTLDTIPNSKVEYPLSTCDGFIATDYKEYPDEKRWIKNNCKLSVQEDEEILSQRSPLQCERSPSGATEETSF